MRRAALLLPLLLAAATPVAAQTGSDLLSQLGGKGGAGALGGGGLGTLLGGLAPKVGAAGASNITGLLGYCLKNQLIGGGAAAATPAAGGASGLLGKLTGRQGVTQSQGFLAGQQGVVQTGGGNLPLGSLGDTVKQQVCRNVLTRAQGLLGR